VKDPSSFPFFSMFCVAPSLIELFVHQVSPLAVLRSCASGRRSAAQPAAVADRRCCCPILACDHS
jgi:hypothetical protein